IDSKPRKARTYCCAACLPACCDTVHNNIRNSTDWRGPRRPNHNYHTSEYDEFHRQCRRMVRAKTRGVSLLCRMAVMGSVANQSTILVRLPYSEAGYLMSTNGKTYER